MKVVVKDFSIRGKHFVIVKHQDLYCAIEDKYITDGKVNKRLNGGEMHAGQTLEDCIHFATDYAEVEYLVEQGHTRAEAIAIYWDMLDKLAEIEVIVGKE